MEPKRTKYIRIDYEENKTDLPKVVFDELENKLNAYPMNMEDDHR